MKKVFVLLAGVAITFVTSCGDERIVSADKLPQPAQDFITTHFSDATITRVVKDTDDIGDYHARLSNGFSLEFSNAGSWLDVDGQGVVLPVSFLGTLPQPLTTYVQTNHASQSITRIQLNKTTYEVRLTGGINLIFDLTGAFIRYDD